MYLMSDHIEKTIADYLGMIREAEAKVQRMKSAVNDLCELADKDPIFDDSDLEAPESGPRSVSYRSDEFYGKPLATSAKQILEDRSRANLGAIPFDDLFHTLAEFGYDFKGKDEKNRTHTQGTGTPFRVNVWL